MLVYLNKAVSYIEVELQQTIHFYKLSILFVTLIKKIEHGAVRKMENSKNLESASSSNGETSERGATKNEKTHQKHTLPTFENRRIQKAKLWWRRFTQYIKMTQNIDLNIMTTDREILNQYRAELEEGIKDLFLWAQGEFAITEMKRTARDNDRNKMDMNQIYSLFRRNFIPERKNVTSFTVQLIFFWNLKREKRNSRRRLNTNSTSRKDLRI